MIKKNTKAIFEDGDYKGEYDWEGGIPLTEGEVISINVNNSTFLYKLNKKETVLKETGEDQKVTTTYTFSLE